jgi:hypothetical protein
MPFVYVQENTPVDVETYDKVNEAMGVQDNPPEGMIIHTASRTDAGMTIVDVWESQEAMDRFRDERLMPAIREVVGEPQGPEPQVKVLEVYDLVKP